MKRNVIVFIVIALAVTLSASAFSDVGERDWYAENVSLMTEKGYLKGYPDGSFRPNEKITGAEFVSVVARIKGLSGKTAQNSHWAGPMLQSALEAGWYDWDELPPHGEYV